jgi:hypothetical protein
MNSIIYVTKSKHDQSINPQFDEVINLFLDCFYSQSKFFFSQSLIDTSYFFTFLKYFKQILKESLINNQSDFTLYVKDVNLMIEYASNQLTIEHNPILINEGLDIISKLMQIRLILESNSKQKI